MAAISRVRNASQVKRPSSPSATASPKARPSQGAWKTSSPLRRGGAPGPSARSEEHTSELQSQSNLVCRLLLEKKKLPLRHQAHTRPQLPRRLAHLEQTDVRCLA